MRFALLLIGVLLFSSYFLIAQVRDDIIKKHIAAIGGEKNWQGIKTMTLSAVKESEGATIEEKKQIISGKAVRIDYKFKSRDAAVSKKNYFIIVYEDRGWKYLPDNLKDSIESLNAEEVQYYRSAGVFSDPFLQPDKEGTKVEYLNKENIMDREYFKFSIRYSNGRHEYVYLDSKTYLIAKKVSIHNDAELELDFEDFRKVNNSITLPFRVNSSYENYIIKDLQINPLISEQVFKPSYKM